MRSLVLAVALALTATSLSAQDWRGQLKMVENDLRSDRYAHARKWSIKLINSMCEHLGTGPDAMYTLATAVAYRAVAEAGLEKMDDADWYWHVALSIYPKLTQKDWKSYGEVAEALAARNHADEMKIDESEEKPIPVKRTDPKCPLSAIQGGYYQPVTVSAIIDEDGNVRCPKLVSTTTAPTLIYAATEALKNWEFDPISAPARYQVTVNFAPPRP